MNDPKPAKASDKVDLQQLAEEADASPQATQGGAYGGVNVQDTGDAASRAASRPGTGGPASPGGDRPGSDRKA